MSLAENKARIKAGVWQAIAKSNVNLSAISQEDMDKLVGAIADGILGEIDEILGEASGSLESTPQLATTGGEAEKMLWQGRPFLSISVNYQITTERVRIIEGIFAKERRDIELIRVQDIDHKQNLTERALSIGDVFIHSHDKTDPEIVLNNIPNPDEVHEILRRAVLDARKKHGIRYREDM